MSDEIQRGCPACHNSKSIKLGEKNGFPCRQPFMMSYAVRGWREN